MMSISVKSVLNRGSLFVVYVVLTVIESCNEILEEFNAGQQPVEMLDDVLVFLLGTAILCFMCAHYFKQKKSLGELEHQLASVRGRLDQSDRQVGYQYRAVIQKQFDAWQLTPAEQEIAMTLIKGLSFKEVAQIRQTQEKTARQHAANVYRKAGLSGRHELAGWFFEDLFNPEPIES